MWAINGAARRGHLDVVRFLHENRTEGCSDNLLEDAAWAGHLEMVQYLDENTQQRAHWWGLGDASKQGRLELLLVLLSKCPDDFVYSQHPPMILWLYNEVFDELLDQNGAKTSAVEHEILTLLSHLHADSSKLDSIKREWCVTAMLDTALQRGCRRLVWRFFDCRIMLRYVEAAGKYKHPVFLRWAVENGVRLDAATSTKLGYRQGYKELTRYLCEADLVEVLSAVLEMQQWHAIWILNNTRFTKTSSRIAISKAANKVHNASYICVHVNDETRSWCFLSGRDD